MISEDLVLACATMAENDLKFLATLVPQTPDELHLYIKTHYGYTIPRVAVCEGHCSPFKALSDAFFGHSLDCLWVGPRTGGKTLQYAVLDHLMMKHFGTTIANIGAIEEQAKKCYGYIRGFLNLPQFRDDVDGESLMSSTSFTNGAKVEILPATLGRVNSPHPERAHWDEIELTDWKIIQEGLCQNGRTLVQTRSNQRRLDSLKVGDEVWSLDHNGRFVLKPILRTYANGIKPTLRIALSNGRELGCTGNHPVLTERGWVKAEDLVLGDRLVPYVRQADDEQEVGFLPRAHACQASENVLPDVQRANIRRVRLLPSALASSARVGREADAAALAAPDLQDVRHTHVFSARARVHEVLQRERAKEGSLATTQALEDVPLQSLQPAALGEGRAVSRVSSRRPCRASTDDARIESSQSRYFTREQWRAEQGRATYGRASYEHGNCLRMAIRMRSIFHRLLSSGEQYRFRSLWFLAYATEAVRKRSNARSVLAREVHASRRLLDRPGGILDGADSASVSVIGIAAGPTEAVYDITVADTHNFVAEGVVVHNSMPVRTNGRPPATIYTSSRKKAYGPMEILLEQAAEAKLAGSEGLKTYFWCVFEIIERCPPERHQNGAKEGCGSCQLQDVCRPKLTDPYGNESFAPGPGKAARARGWMAIDDVITKFIRMDRSVFDAQWLSLRPETGGLAYPMFDEHVHVIDYTYNSAFPVVCGIDFGYTNPSVALYAQPTPSDDVVIFAEDYASGRTADVFAQSMMREPWFNNTAWRSADTAAAGDRATLTGMGVENEPADKSSSIMDLPNVLGGIALCRWALRPMGRKRPILYIARSCKNTIREIKKYHTPDQKEDKNAEERPVKSDDHAMDAMRYMMVRLYRGMLNV